MDCKKVFERAHNRSCATHLQTSARSKEIRGSNKGGWGIARKAIEAEYPNNTITLRVFLNEIPFFNSLDLMHSPELAQYVRQKPNYQFYSESIALDKDLPDQMFIEHFATTYTQFRNEFYDKLSQIKSSRVQAIERLASRIQPIVIEEFKKGYSKVTSLKLNGVDYQVCQDRYETSTVARISGADVIGVQEKYEWECCIVDAILGTDIVDIRYRHVRKTGRANWVHLTDGSKATASERKKAKAA